MIDVEKDGLLITVPEDNYYDIEDVLHSSTLSSVKTPELIARVPSRRHMCHVFVEAKSSAPQFKRCKRELCVYNGEPLPENWEVVSDFHVFLRAIAQKFMDAFCLCTAMMEGRHGEDRFPSLPDGWTRFFKDRTKFALILDSDLLLDAGGMVQLAEALRQEMRHFLRAWNIPDHSVIVTTPRDSERLTGIPIRRVR